MSKGAKIPHAVIAAVRDDTVFRAIALRRQNDHVEIRWARQMRVDDGTWESFAAQCGLASGSPGLGGAGSSRAKVVVGLESTAVAFYKINAPKVGWDETDAIVRMQAESFLPLPPSEIEVAWRRMPSTNGTVDITIAATRGDHLQQFVSDTRAFKPQTILPACEGTARTWHELFSERDRRALILSISERNTQVCLVVDGAVANAAVLDVGMGSLAVATGEAASSPVATEIVERFAQDVRSVAESFAWSESAPWPMLVLSDGSETIGRLVKALNAAGLDARASVPKAQTLGAPVGLGPQDLYQYRAPLGLALIGLDEPSETLDLYARLNEVEQAKKAKSAWQSTTLAAIAAAVMLVVFIATWYVVDATSAKRLTGLVNLPEFKQARDHQLLLKTVAQHRPDLLGLLTDINAGQNDGIVLDKLHFKKGQAVTIMGRAGNMEQMWKFQENLLGQKGIKDVKITNNSTDAKSKKIKFTMEFQYKRFTKKDAVL